MEYLHISLQSHDGKLAKYPAKAHVRRVAEAADLSDGVIVLKGERSVYYSNSDQPRHFRQDRYFYYLTGCNEPNCYVSYDIREDVLTLWLPPIDLSRAFYNGRGSTAEEALEKYDIDRAKYVTTHHHESITDLESLLSYMAGWQSKHDFDGIEDILSALSLPFPKFGLTDMKPALDRCRAVKDEDEIKLIKKANEISSKAHLEVLKRLGHLTHEAEAEGLYTNVCISNGAKEQAYGPIVGSGPNAGILHHQGNNEAFGDRQVLLIDASCEWELYAADITRTMPLNAEHPGYWPSKEAEAVYKAVEKIQEECIKMLRPGVKFIDVHLHAQSMTIDALLKLGILKGEKSEIAMYGTVTAFAPHGLGHHLGLEVHDLMPAPAEETDDAEDKSLTTHDESMSNLHPFQSNYALDVSLFRAPCRPEAPSLEPGNVITIEPGIYFNKFILDNLVLNKPMHREHIDVDVLKRYMPVGGVRIEDDILITKDGYENLTGAAKGEKMLKIIRGDA